MGLPRKVIALDSLEGAEMRYEGEKSRACGQNWWLVLEEGVPPVEFLNFVLERVALEWSYVYLEVADEAGYVWRAVFGE